jgi:nucleotide-binding universal stress UspA family protein
MIKKALVPLDGSRLAEGILEAVIRLLKETQGTLILFHAITPAESFSMTASRFVAQERQRVSAYLEKLGERFEERGIGIRTLIATGEASKSIVAAAVKEGADLIALSTHGRSGIREWAFGSVAERVLRTTRLPVLVFRGKPATSFSRILVPLDGSEAALEVVPSAADLARAFGAEVELVHVGKKLPLSMESALRAFNRQGLRVRSRLLHGDPAEGILGAAAEEEADLVALTTTGKTREDRLFFGSVAEQVLKRADRPLLVVRARGEA